MPGRFGIPALLSSGHVVWVPITSTRPHGVCPTRTHSPLSTPFGAARCPPGPLNCFFGRPCGGGALRGARLRYSKPGGVGSFTNPCLVHGVQCPFWGPLGRACGVILEHAKGRLGSLQHIYNMGCFKAPHVIYMLQTPQTPFRVLKDYATCPSQRAPKGALHAMDQTRICKGAHTARLRIA